jgi:hypothetical protein
VRCIADAVKRSYRLLFGEEPSYRKLSALAFLAVYGESGVPAVLPPPRFIFGAEGVLLVDCGVYSEEVAQRVEAAVRKYGRLPEERLIKLVMRAVGVEEAGALTGLDVEGVLQKKRKAEGGGASVFFV